MKADVLNIKGEKKGSIDLPVQFSEKFHPIVIKRAFNSNISYNYQHHGTDVLAGLRHVTELRKRRHVYRSVYGAGRSRTPKKIISRRGNRFVFIADQAPHTRKGRTAHPPLVEKKFEEKINKKERLLAIRSAISATAKKDIVLTRNHKVEKINIPIIIEGIEGIKQTKQVSKLFETIGLKDEIKRASIKKVRAGKGKMRGRKYKTRKGPLIVVSKDCSLIKASKGILGVEAIPVNQLNVTVLAPGGVPGRLTIWTAESIKEMSDKKLFTGEKQ